MNINKQFVEQFVEQQKQQEELGIKQVRAEEQSLALIKARVEGQVIAQAQALSKALAKAQSQEKEPFKDLKFSYVDSSKDYSQDVKLGTPPKSNLSLNLTLFGLLLIIIALFYYKKI